jgi:hypothetical protein
MVKKSPQAAVLRLYLTPSVAPSMKLQRLVILS